jgi:hypothetical protein
MPSLSARERAEITRAMPEVWRRVIAIALKSDDEQAVLKAATILADRVYGKPAQSVQIEDTGGLVGKTIAAYLQGKELPKHTETIEGETVGEKP